MFQRLPIKQNPPLIAQGWEKIAMKKKNTTKLELVMSKYTIFYLII